MRVRLDVEVDHGGDTVEAVAIVVVDGEFRGGADNEPPDVTLVEVVGLDGRSLTVTWAQEQSLRERALDVYRGHLADKVPW